ncbi:serine/threonine-protein phosphatase 4 regulatory subunit 2 isoform X3 [Macaca fascicularis]|uniref:serine/threonine-protein phosphatase 4 regulatory subunit 2 isoform X3 n=1 Tax=Macaca fascicularis TaxID=9541 RepID=UPI003D157ADC
MVPRAGAGARRGVGRALHGLPSPSTSPGAGSPVGSSLPPRSGFVSAAGVWAGGGEPGNLLRGPQSFYHPFEGRVAEPQTPPCQASSFLCQATRTPGVGVGEKVKDFEKRGKKEVCPVLDQFLCHVAKTGETIIPFTIQRLCELLTDPRRNYTGTDKFLRGVEKNVMVVSCVYPSSEKNNSNSLNRMNGVMFPGNSPSYTERSNINGPGTPRPLNRPKVSLSAPMTTNGLPESTDSKDTNLQQNEEKNHSDSSTSESQVSSVSPLKNKHPDEDAVEAEGHEVKRLRFDKESDVRETASQTTSSEISSVMVEETEASSSSQDKDKESRCTRQHCTEEDEEEDEEEEEESFMTSREMIPERKNQEKESDDALTVNEETSEENNQMEESDVSQAEKDLLHSEGGENEGPVSSGSSDCRETEELVGSNSSKTGEILSESSMENDDEATEVTDEPMEQD